MPDGNPLTDALMQMAGGGGGAPGGMPGGAPPPGGAPGGPPPGQPPGGPQAGGPPGQPGGGQPDPKELIINGLMALQFGMSAMGGDETMSKVRQMVQKFVERTMKSTPQGQQGAAMAGALPGKTPPGVGSLPGPPTV